MNNSNNIVLEIFHYLYFPITPDGMQNNIMG